MNINDPRDEAILSLVASIRQSDTNRNAIELANRAEAIVRCTQGAQKLAAQLNEAMAEKARADSIESAHKWMKEHMPKSVSTFGGSDGVFGWTGTDAAGNRVTWKVEPPAAAVVGEGNAPKSSTETMKAFADFAPTVTAAAEKRFAADPFARTFEVLPGEDAITIKLYPRLGSVQYLVSATGPRSAAIKVEAALPKFVQVERLAECEPGS
ncbi:MULTISPECIES: hypothetical protein [unclassified Duganella]|uniref:hypothetical protein n=1 Tax=unclassified Duganella TaxID=2636909 RepID=UPI0008871B98|nr:MULTISPECIES: hypothetical protein [unclassified Duganella]SDF80200.1 hypothetical protein SAMN05216320_1011368 [Duganella sp. OV458]SDI48982.1 hypothetical protein SAMN05428973_10147 [Duganella sp. OV510]